MPIAYICHLRTFMFLWLLTLPLVLVREWPPATVPGAALLAFIMVGLLVSTLPYGGQVEPLPIIGLRGTYKSLN